MQQHLTADELVELISRVFRPGADDHALAVLVDLPDAHVADSPQWLARREMAADWARLLGQRSQDLGGMRVNLVLYRNARLGNADLPDTVHLHPADRPLPAVAEELNPGTGRATQQVISEHSILLAPTEMSATAPLKLAARQHGIRAATMPGFSAAMIPALRLDYTEINRRVARIKDLLDRAEGALCVFAVQDREYNLGLDLRHREGHASGGLFPLPGVAGNLPSGEAYIVPYEGELSGDQSRSAGLLPVQLGDEVVVYEVEQNRAMQVVGDGPAARAEAARLQADPAYGNLAELGLGVLSDFGLEPIGELLLDEKLGLHIAFGRSDHFGGQVGAAQFSSPEAVVHIDRVYLPSMQPLVQVPRVDLHLPGGERLPLIRDHEYVVDWGANS